MPDKDLGRSAIIMHKLACLLLLFFAGPSQAEVRIPAGCHVANKPGGYCCYCAIETMGRFYGIKETDGLVAWYSQWKSQGADYNDVKKCLDSLQVGYQQTLSGSVDHVKGKVDHGIPVMISAWWGKGYHAVVVVDFVKDDGVWWVKYIDSNRVGWNCYMTRKEFEENFTGWVVEIHEPIPKPRLVDN